MKNELIAAGLLSIVGGAAAATDVYAAETEPIEPQTEMQEDSQACQELTSEDYYFVEEAERADDSSPDAGTLPVSGSDENEGQATVPADKPEESLIKVNDSEPNIEEETVDGTENVRTAANQSLSHELQGVSVENKAITQSQLNGDFVLVHATSGEAGKDSYLNSNANAVLNAQKLLGIYHTGGSGSASKEAENFYLSSKDYIGKAVFILNANGALGDGGTAWVRDFLDWFHQFSGVKAICYETGHSPESYDWSLVNPVYKVWSDQKTVESSDFKGTITAGQWEGTAAEWVAEAKPDKQGEYSVDMYRLYNVFSSEHLFTASSLERDVLSKNGAWNYEGIAWRNPLTGGNAVYRLYNPYNSEHHYTTSTLERDSLMKVGWNYEGIGWQTDPAKATAVYRLYNPNLKSGYHLFTTSSLEYNALTKMGWKQEGIAWYASQYFSTVKDSHYLRGEYAYDERGRKSVGIQKTGNGFYYANPNNGGKIEKSEGIYSTNTGKIYVTATGKLYVGQKNIDNGWKWFRPENALMAVNSFIDIPAAYNSGTAKTCYYDANGNMVKGTQMINGLRYIFDTNSGAWNNQIDVNIQKLCQSVYQQVGRDLKAVYDWCVRSISYQTLPIPLNPPAGYTAEQNYAIRGLRDRKGNCYCYAAAVTNLARNLGYQARFCTGGVLLSNGSYSNHGWCEITINGTRYILDAEAETEYRGVSFYMQPASKPKLNYKEY